MLETIKQQALLDQVPIMKDDALQVICDSIVDHHALFVLEFGTAIGYSSLTIAQKCPWIKMDTIEKDEARYKQAIHNKQQLNNTNVSMHCADAKKWNIPQFYDVIIIDAAKAQNKFLFERALPFLKPRGIMFVDNMHFHGFVDEIPMGKRKRNLRQMVQKIQAFKEYITSLDYLESEMMDVGDGLLKIQRKHV